MTSPKDCSSAAINEHNLPPAIQITDAQCGTSSPPSRDTATSHGETFADAQTGDPLRHLSTTANRGGNPSGPSDMAGVSHLSNDKDDKPHSNTVENAPAAQDTPEPTTAGRAAPGVKVHRERRRRILSAAYAKLDADVKAEVLARLESDRQMMAEFGGAEEDGALEALMGVLDAAERLRRRSARGEVKMGWHGRGPSLTVPGSPHAASTHRRAPSSLHSVSSTTSLGRLGSTTSLRTLGSTASLRTLGSATSLRSLVPAAPSPTRSEASRNSSWRLRR